MPLLGSGLIRCYVYNFLYKHIVFEDGPNLLFHAGKQSTLRNARRFMSSAFLRIREGFRRAFREFVRRVCTLAVQRFFISLSMEC